MPASPDDGAAYAARVTEYATELELWLLGRLAHHLETAASEDAWEQAALLALQRWRSEANRGIRDAEAKLLDAVTTALMSARNDGAALALTDLERLDVEIGRPGSATEVIRQAGRLAGQLQQALLQAPRLLEQTFREATAAGVREVLGGQVTRLQAAQHVLDRLGSQGVTGFRDAAGRNWSLSSYVEMSVRTEAGHQAVQGHVDMLASAGIDLVVVSDSPRECPLCRPWEGKVLSLTGQVGAVIVPSATEDRGVRVDVAGTLDQARRDGLQHPNCRHSVSAYLPGATRLSKPKTDPAGYEAGQRQRAMERKVREWKRREALALDDTARARARGKVREWQGALREHVDANDLKRLRRREGGPGLAT